MSSFIPSAGQNSNNGLSSQFLQRALNFQSQQQSGRVTIDDLAEQRAPDQPESGESSNNENSAESGESRNSGRRTIETGRSEDARVSGDGFVSLDVGGEQRFSRSVSLSIDSEGNVRDDITGGQVQTESTDDSGETTTENLQLSEEQRTIEAQATSEASFSGNIQDTLVEGNSRTFEAEVTDSSGQAQTVTFEATRTAENQVELTAQDPNSGDTALQATVNFTEDGSVDSVNVEENASGNNGLTVSDGSGGSVNVSAENLDFSGLSLSAGETTAQAETDGNASGQLQSLSVSGNGQIQGQFSNGETRNFGEIATAQFENADGLSQSSNGTFSATEASGEANFSADSNLQSGELETQGSDNTTQIVDDLLADSPQQNRGQILGSALDLFG